MVEEDGAAAAERQALEEQLAREVRSTAAHCTSSTLLRCMLWAVGGRAEPGE